MANTRNTFKPDTTDLNLLITQVVNNLTNFTEDQLLELADRTSFELMDREERNFEDNTDD